MANLRIDRKAYHRKAYVKEDGTTVKSADVPRSIFLAKDRGAPGRGEKVVEISKPGSLGEGFFSRPVSEQHKILGGIAKKEGVKSAAGKVRAIQVFNKRTNPALAKKAAADAKWVNDNY